MFTTKIKEKIILLKQRRCIKAIEYVTDAENLNIYNKGNNIIKCHRTYMDINDLYNPLVSIRNFYLKDLDFKKAYYKKSTGVADEKLLMYQSIKDDLNVLDILTDGFIEQYNRITRLIDYIEDNKEYLNQEQFRKYLCEYYRLVDANFDINRTLVRIVK